MRIVAVFFGIVILMFYKEHEPAPFHAEHQGQHAKFDFDGKVAAGIESTTNGADVAPEARYEATQATRSNSAPQSTMRTDRKRHG